MLHTNWRARGDELRGKIIKEKDKKEEQEE
jgi:hypothetical protein